ncbi:MAG: ChbG/HpnK family deacetylase [Mariprofundales bacterium]|nr:ChbG/HpnK family deacetylase [Mariprofundales bacterium]
MITELGDRAPTRLVVNADDFGMNTAINGGIIQAHLHGIVTSTSLMANGACWQEAVALSRKHPTFDTGIHLTLVDGAPISPTNRIPSLLDANGKFLPDIFTFTRRYLRGAIQLAQVECELEAQIKRLQNQHVTISHLDSHQHSHMLPGIYQLVRRLAIRHGIRFIRSPAETQYHLFHDHSPCWPRLIQQWGLWALSRLQSPLPCHTNDAFAGFYNGGALNLDALTAIIHHLPQGKTTELMCHPGLAPSSEHRGAIYHRDAELAALTNPAIESLLEHRHIQRTTYRKITGEGVRP